jgi:hypothetical protein
MERIWPTATANGSAACHTRPARRLLGLVLVARSSRGGGLCAAPGALARGHRGAGGG